LHRLPRLCRDLPARRDRGGARVIHPIETESYRILGTRVDLSHLDPGPRAVVERVIHASADPEYATSTVVDPAAVDTGVRALRAGGLPAISNVGEKGGSAVAAAAVNALVRLAARSSEGNTS